MDAALRAGIAVYNADYYHAAHDAWEAEWLDCEAGDDERFLQGLIQFTAAVHHAANRNWDGAVGLCDSASDYLDGLPTAYRGTNVDDVRAYLVALGSDPERIERASPHGSRTMERCWNSRPWTRPPRWRRRWRWANTLATTRTSSNWAPNTRERDWMTATSTSSACCSATS